MCIRDRQGGPRPPELDEEPAEGGGEPSTIERPRMRARLANQGEPARPPGEARREDPLLPHSPGETSAGPPTPSEAVWSREKLAKTKGGSGESDTNNEGNDHTGRRITLGRRARERIKEGRNPGKTRGEPSGAGGSTQMSAQVSAEWWYAMGRVVWCSLAPSRGGVLQLRGNPVRGANSRTRVYFTALSLRTRTPPRGQGSQARSPIPIIRPAGCAS